MKPEIIVSRFDQLVSDRETADAEFQVIERFVAPYRNEFYTPMTSEHQVNWRRRNIYDATAVWARNRLASFIHSNLTNPSMPWFEITFREGEVNDDQAVKEWKDEVNNLLWQGLRESDFNGEIGSTYDDLTSFGNNTLLMEERDDMEWKGMDFTSCPLMDTYFEMGARSAVKRSYFRKRMTDLQLLDRFPDIDVKLLSSADEAEGSTDAKKEVILCIYYRDLEDEPDITKPLAPEARPIGYKWVMKNCATELEEGGYYYMPSIVTRWDRVAGSDYGHSPSHLLLGHILQLNEFTAQISEAASKAIDPTFWTTVRGLVGDANNGPGGLMNVKKGPYGQEFGVIPEGSNFPAGEMDRERLVRDILSVYAVDLLDLKESPAMTAYEVRARLDRIMRQYAPVIAKLEKTLMVPVVMNLFMSMYRLGQIPEIPEAAQGQEMDIEFTSPMPLALRNEGAQGIQVFVDETMKIAQMSPEVMDTVDWDEAVKLNQEHYGVPATILRDEKEVEQVRAQRAEQEQAMVEAQGIEQGGKALEAAGKGAQAAQAAGMEVPQ